VVAFKVWQQIVQNPLRKTPYSLCKSWREYWDLQLSYSPLCTLLFKIFEKNAVKPKHTDTFEPNAPRRAPSRGRARTFPRPPRAPRRLGVSHPALLRTGRSPRRTDQSVRCVHFGARLPRSLSCYGRFWRCVRSKTRGSSPI
jgi:hypothetical protein